MSFIPSYCLNGFHDHRLPDALELLKRLGYGGVALTVGAPHLAGDRASIEQAGRLLRAAGLSVVLETGGRYWLDPARKHYPVLVSPDARAREVRLTALVEAADTAAALGAAVLHCWAGAVEPGTDEEAAWGWLVDGVGTVCDAAAQAGVVVGFEPEPGHLVATLAHWHRLKADVGHAALKLTVDLGHIVCSEPEPWPDALRAVLADVVHVQIDDHRPGTHEHLPFGEGVAPTSEFLQVLVDAGYEGHVAVELARHSHDAPNQAARSIEILRTALA